MADVCDESLAAGKARLRASSGACGAEGEECEYRRIGKENGAKAMRYIFGVPKTGRNVSDNLSQF